MRMCRGTLFMYTLYTIKTWIQIRARSHAQTCTSQIPKKMTAFFPSHILNNIWPSVIWYFFCTQRIKLFRYVSHNYACETVLVSSCVFFCPFLNKQQEGKITNMKKKYRKSREMGNTRKYLHSMWKSIRSLCPIDMYLYIRVSAKTLILAFQCAHLFSSQYIRPGWIHPWWDTNCVSMQCFKCSSNVDK